MPNTFPARDRSFISTLSADLHLSITWDEYDEEDQNLVTWRLPGSIEEPIPEPGSEPNEAEDDEQWEDVSDEDEEESQLAVDRVLQKYEKAPVKNDDEGGGFDARHEKSVSDKMDEWKRTYYKVRCKTRSLVVPTPLFVGQGKLEISYDDPEQMRALIFKYAQGLQWVMHYYYSGVASWGWFYNYHYAPRISGISILIFIGTITHFVSKDLVGLEDMEFQFELGKPFQPFEQLMGVLPSASKDLLPLAFQVICVFAPMVIILTRIS